MDGGWRPTPAYASWGPGRGRSEWEAVGFFGGVRRPASPLHAGVRAAGRLAAGVMVAARGREEHEPEADPFRRLCAELWSLRSG